MKRIRLIGLCLVAVFAFTAIGVSSASAEAPEFGRCLKKAVAGGEGYNDSGCKKTKVTTGAKFEWTTAIVKNKFSSKIKELTTATLETVGGTKITCTGESGPGEYKNSKEVGKVEPLFTGCSTSGIPCNSVGQGEGIIKTSPLGGVLGVEKLGLKEGKLEPALNKLAVELHSEAGNVAEFSCGGLPVVVKGSVLHAVKTGVMVLTATEKFTASKGEQKPDKFVGEGVDAHILESNTNGGPFEEAGQTITAILTNEEKVEANPVA